MKRAANLINKSGLEEREIVVEDSMVGHFLHAAFSIYSAEQQKTKKVIIQFLN